MRITNDFIKNTPITPAQNRHKTSSNQVPASNNDYAENPVIKTDFSQIAFGAIYNVKNKKIDLVVEKNKLLKQLRELLSSYCGDTDPTDLLFGAIDRALKAFKIRLDKENKILEQLDELTRDFTLTAKQKYEQALALKKEYEAIRKTYNITAKKTVIPQEDERIDYILLNKFKTALEEGNFNLNKIQTEYYSKLHKIKSIDELNKTYPKIKTPKRPEEVIAAKITSTLTKDFYEELDRNITTGNDNGATHLLEKKISEITFAAAQKYSVNPTAFAMKIVKATTKSILESYDKLKERDLIASVPTVRKSNNLPISDLDIKLLSIDFDDFVLSTIQEQYLEGKKLNQIIYSDGKVKINLNSLRGSEYKFEKMPEKVKRITKDAEALFNAQRDYSHYDIDEFHTRLNHYAGTEIGSNENIFNTIVDFDACKFTDEDVNILIKFLKELDSITDGEISLEQGAKRVLDYTPKGTEKQNELEIQKAKQLLKLEQKNALELKTIKKEFNDVINQLYSNNLNNIAQTCSKYEPQSLETAEIERAKYLIKFITDNIPTDGTPINKYKLETDVRRWDTFTTHQKTAPQSETFKKALQYAEQKDGTTDINKAGQYLINSEIVTTYPACADVIENPEIVAKIMERDSANAVEYLCKFDDYKDLAPKDKNSIIKITEIFNPKNQTDKAILKHIIENDYITSDTSALIEISEGGKPITATIAAKAKQQIIDKYKYPKCLDYFISFENALSNMAGERGSSGIKNTGRNNKAIQYRMELKIMGEDDRLLSSNNDYYFDIFSDKGMH